MYRPNTVVRPDKPYSILARLDRLPVMASHYVWAALLAANLMLEYYDNAIFAYASPTIKAHTNLSTEQLGLISSAFFIGMIIGALAGGRLSDRWGRRSVLVWTTVLYSLGALATAFAPTYETILASRVVTGIGVQAATSVLLVYIAEMFPGNARGRFVSIVTIGFVVSGVGAAALAMFYLPHSSTGAWRNLFLAGSVGLLIAPLVRVILPESVRWCVSCGRFDRAERIVSELEARALRRGPLDEPGIAATQQNGAAATLRDLINDKAVLRTIAVLTLGYFGATLAYYLFGQWGVYSLVYSLKYSEEHAYHILFLWNLIYGVTPFVAMLFLDRYERKSTILFVSVLSALPLVVLGISATSWVVIGAGGLASVITGLVVNAYYTYIPEAIPTQLRALGSGIVISGGRFGGAAAGVLGAALFSASGMAGVMLVAAACYIVFSIPVGLFGPRTTKRSLEAVTGEGQDTANGVPQSPDTSMAA
ncbi:MFS transporter [Cupriavidus taiwanensis]|uniref:Major facilitator superfamily transporter AAHS family protein n=1 Tax=Cupriavidus taiwanensis TaxID=164546 RepID=A0A375J7K2_9BURK|nr:MFS transporter [Cupriavidus taiwanensis]SPS00702.1 Major facilitator superfamily transporter AAHS family protein [Cupriavidus taiwanensis]